MAWPRISLFSGSPRQRGERAAIDTKRYHFGWKSRPQGPKRATVAAYYPYEEGVLVVYEDDDRWITRVVVPDPQRERVRSVAWQLLVDGGLSMRRAEEITEPISDFEEQAFAYELARATRPLTEA